MGGEPGESGKRDETGTAKAELIRELEALGAPVAGSAVEGAIQALCESEERYRLVTELCRDAITVTDGAGLLIYVNPAMQEIFGVAPEEVIGTELSKYFDVVHPDDRDRVVTNFQEVQNPGDTVYYPPMRCRHKDGRWLWIKSITTSYVSAGGERYLLEVHQDISEQVEAKQRDERLAEQMREAQRLESLGVLAGGIAHDFNNLLAPILGDASLALLDLPANSPARLRLERIHSAAQRAAALTNQMLTYSGQRPASTEALDVSQLVKELAQLLEGAMSGKGELAYNLAPDLPAVVADPAQLSQVVMNLITNATEAVQEGSGRTQLRTGEIEAEKLEPKFLVGSSPLASGSYVFIEVADDGCGMNAQTQSKIFDPFFTTKFTGRGLGLAATLGIVRSHGGAIEIESEVGRGTRFRVLFPSAGHQLLTAASEQATSVDWRGHGCVLVADDDESVLELVAETLERAGLRVLRAGDGQQAIELFRLQPDAIQVVVLDRTMPNVDGEEAFDQIRRIRSDARIILMSGYSEDSARRSISREIDAFLQKPFEPLTLVDQVRRLL